MVSTVNQAVVLLGFQKTWQIALSASMMNLFTEKSELFDREVFWEHSLKVGVCAQIIGKLCRFPKPAELYTLGLLHDLGKLVFDMYFHDQFIEAVTLVKEKHISFVEAENTALGMDHTTIGGWLINRWKLPDFFVEGIVHHHGTFDSSVSKIALIVGLADAICLRKGIGMAYNSDSINKTYDSLIVSLEINENEIKEIENFFDESAARITIIS